MSESVREIPEESYRWACGIKHQYGHLVPMWYDRLVHLLLYLGFISNGPGCVVFSTAIIVHARCVQPAIVLMLGSDGVSSRLEKTWPHVQNLDRCNLSRQIGNEP